MQISYLVLSMLKAILYAETLPNRVEGSYKEVEWGILLKKKVNLLSFDCMVSEC